MELYNFCHSSTSFRVRIALELKGLKYTYHGVNLRAGEQCSAAYLEINPAASVPLLITSEGVSLSQSLAIIEYLDTCHPEPRLIPEDPIDRMRVNEIANLIACDIHPLNNVRVLDYLSKKIEISDNERRDWYRHWADQGLAAVEALLTRYGHGSYCFGEFPTLADCALVPQITNALRFGVDLEKYEICMSIYRTCMKNPAFQRAAPSAQPDFVL